MGEGTTSVAAELTERGYRCYGSDPLNRERVLYQRRVGEDDYVNVLEYAPGQYRNESDYEVESCFDRGDGTWARVLIYGVPRGELLTRLSAIEQAHAAARRALLTTP